MRLRNLHENEDEYAGLDDQDEFVDGDRPQFVREMGGHEVVHFGPGDDIFIDGYHINILYGYLRDKTGKRPSQLDGLSIDDAYKLIYDVYCDTNGPTPDELAHKLVLDMDKLIIKLKAHKRSSQPPNPAEVRNDLQDALSFLISIADRPNLPWHDWENMASQSYAEIRARESPHVQQTHPVDTPEFDQILARLIQAHHDVVSDPTLSRPWVLREMVNFIDDFIVDIIEMEY